MSYTTQNQGGEYKHVLSAIEMPKHNHIEVLYFTKNSAQRSLGAYMDENNGGYKLLDVAWGRSSTTPQTTEVTGGGVAHNNVMPYITVYFWRRLS